MKTQTNYAPYDELRAARCLLPDETRCLQALRRAFRRFLDHETAGLKIALVGPFAQSDYLLKEHRASTSLRHAVGTFRKDSDTLGCDMGLMVLSLFVQCVTGEPVPEDLAACFPRKTLSRAKQKNRRLADVVRLIVERWDDDVIEGTATTPDGDTLSLEVRYTPQHAYLHSMLEAHTQLNLIGVTQSSSDNTLLGVVCTAEHIIYEPDCLINITSVAKCFESFAESPLLHLLARLKPNTTTEHTILGNLAGQLLDEAVHSMGEEGVPYAESVGTFFQHHAAQLLTTTLPTDFHDRARKQGEHIRYAIGKVLPEEVGAFCREDVLLEPSFYSEMLGLQGRMDLLQTDMKVLIEQKSGKGAFVPNDPDPNTPKAAEQHYVQMLLYMLLVRYNYPERYHSGTDGIQAFLLYSRYPNCLLKLDFAPELVQRALRIRNGIAWMEMQLGSNASGWTWERLLLPLHADMLNTKQSRGRLWTDFKKPELEALLAPIHQASPLERAYYFRMLQFVSREHLLAKIGCKTRQNAGFAAAWHDTLDEKRQAGNIYDRLKLDGVGPLRFRFSDTEANDMANFRIGDIVALYPYTPGSTPDIRHAMVHRASIETIAVDYIELRLRAEQTDPNVFLRHEADEWAIEHDFMEASYGGLYRGIHDFLSAPQERRDLLLLQRMPQQSDRLLRGEYGDFNPLMQGVKNAQDFFLIIGPPGTGKTSFGMRNTLIEELLEPGSRVLLLSYTNRAVDEICSKLLDEGIDFIRLGNEQACAPACRPHLLSARIAECKGLESLRALFLQSRVVCATTTSAASHIDLLALRPFSLCIIDEASQILEPHLLGLLSARAMPSENTGNGVQQTQLLIRKFVMIGDHKQLPAVVKQSAEESAVTRSNETQDDSAQCLLDAGLTNCRLSLFERLLRRYRSDERVVHMLTRQGRMHQDIASFPNHTFYGGRLCEVPLPHQVAQWNSNVADGAQLFAQRVVFVDVPAPHSSISDKVNQAEAEVIADATLHIIRKEKSLDPEKTLGIIVPYRNQIATVRNTIERRLTAEGLDTLLARAITIDTVERFQGSQRRFIIYGFTVQQSYQLDFLTDHTFEEDGRLIDRKLNVVMTRAMEHLLLVGNQRLLSRVPVFKSLIDFLSPEQKTTNS
ncbi:MAG: AAA family ATPase [Bacteroidales bacterium]|nr:AAA family ATPase [Candidatus Physcousia equi]